MKDMLTQEHKGEAIIPGRDNAALSQGDVVTPTLGWADELPSKPSKRELLEQILAEQRKMNELLARMTGESGALVRSSVLSGAEVRILCQLDA